MKYHLSKIPSSPAVKRGKKRAPWKFCYEAPFWTKILRVEKLSKFGKFERAGVIFQVCAHEMFYFLAQNVSFDPLKLLVIDRACEYAFATKEGKFYENFPSLESFTFLIWKVFPN